LYSQRGLEAAGQLSSSRVSEALSEAETIDTSIQRLGNLFRMDRLKFIGDLLGEGLPRLDPEIELDVLNAITHQRPHRDAIVNAIDAANYALAFALNRERHDQYGEFWLLVTSSPIPFRTFDAIKWTSDPLRFASSDLRFRTSLVRHPTQVKFYSQVTQGNIEPKRLKTVSEDIDGIQDRWNRIPDYAVYVKRPDERRAIRRVRLPRARDYQRRVARFAELWNTVFRPTGEILANDVAWETNRRNQLRIAHNTIADMLGPPDSVPGGHEPGIAKPTLRYRNVIQLWDRLIERTATEVSRGVGAGRVLDEKDIADLDSTGFFFSSTELSSAKLTDAPIPGVDAHLILIGPKAHARRFLIAERYPSFYNFVWPTTTDFHEFLQAMRVYLRKASTDVSDVNARRGRLGRRRKKAFDGLLVATNDRVIRIPSRRIPDYSHTTLMALLDPTWKIRFVRIATDLGDFSYEFMPMHTISTVALVTHVRHAPAIASMIQLTHSNFASRASIVSVLAGLFEQESPGE